MKIPPSKPPTLQELVKNKKRELGITTAQLVASIGYPRNINKGIRRLNDFLATLDAPNDEFVVNLINALAIDALSFHRALMASIDLMKKDAEDREKLKFRPHIIVLRDKKIQPILIDQILTKQNTIIIPAEIQELPLIDELNEIFKIYNNFNNRIYYSNTKEVHNFTRVGLRYHRKHNYFLQFNSNLKLIRVASIGPQAKFKMGLANRMVDLLSGSTPYQD